MDTKDRARMAEWAVDNLRLRASQDNWPNLDASITLEVFNGEDWLTVDTVYLEIPEDRN